MGTAEWSSPGMTSKKNVGHRSQTAPHKNIRFCAPPRHGMTQREDTRTTKGNRCFSSFICIFFKKRKGNVNTCHPAPPCRHPGAGRDPLRRRHFLCHPSGTKLIPQTIKKKIARLAQGICSAVIGTRPRLCIRHRAICHIAI